MIGIINLQEQKFSYLSIPYFLCLSASARLFQPRLQVQAFETDEGGQDSDTRN